MNDILVAYKYDDTNMITTKEYSIFIKNFSMCTRSKYNNMIWDMWMEIEILKKYALFFSINISYLFNNINSYIRNNYTDTTNTYYVPIEVSPKVILETHNNTNKEQNDTKYMPITSITNNQSSIPILNQHNTLSQNIMINNDNNMNELISIINDIIQNIII
jgi:hypothetical protein